jgi:hypothetical protein
MPTDSNSSATAETGDDGVQDYGLISPISLPRDGRMPDTATGASGQAEYDTYFRVVRESPGLVEWSRSCLQVQRRVLTDLDATSLSPQERYDIIAGCLVVMQTTLEQWLDLHTAREEVA